MNNIIVIRMSRKVTVTVSIDSDIMFRIDRLKSKGVDVNVSKICNATLADWAYSMTIGLNKETEEKKVKVDDNGSEDTVSQSSE